MIELLTPSEMDFADQLTISSGRPGFELMQNAANAVYQTILKEFPGSHRILIVCGLGNNGGDGLVLANMLKDSGTNIELTIIGDKAKIKGDAKLALDQLDSTINIVPNPDWQSFDLIIDCIFGAGLDRNIENPFTETIKNINLAPAKVLSVDLPSGIDGKNGLVRGICINADVSVTFFRRKPGHLLFPGRAHCGKTVVKQIGIGNEVLKQIKPTIFHNIPALWHEYFETPKVTGHKYHRGHTLAVSGNLTKIGATRLMAQSALRTGSGLVTIAAPKETLLAHASYITSLMLCEIDNPRELKEQLKDRRLNTICLGPGMDPDQQTRDMVSAALTSAGSIVIDAGAISAFAEDPKTLFKLIHEHESSCVLTPHDGEFDRLFSDLASNKDRLSKAREASKISGATIVLKGPDTIIAEPKGRTAISDNAPPWLATAGSGDVLTGIIAGLMAQGLPEFEAAAAAVWFHGEAGNHAGPNLISSDLDESLRKVLQDFYKTKSAAD